MRTLFAHSPDGIRIAYDICGEGPYLFLLHGGWQDRNIWHELGWVSRLKNIFTVVTIDIRGNGESDKPIDKEDYIIDKICDDILSVADECGVKRFSIIGFSFGGNIARYIASSSKRVEKAVILGVPFGPSIFGIYTNTIPRFIDHWKPIIEALKKGTLDIQTLNERDRQRVKNYNMPAWIATMQATLSWGTVIPADLLRPALILIGSENEEAIVQMMTYEEEINESEIKYEVIEGFTHMQELTEVDIVLLKILAFLHAKQ